MEDDENRMIAEAMQNEQYGGMPSGSGAGQQPAAMDGGFGNMAQPEVRKGDSAKFVNLMDDDPIDHRNAPGEGFDDNDAYGMDVDEYPQQPAMPEPRSMQPSESEAQLNAAIAASMESAQSQPQPSALTEDEELARVMELSKQFK